MRVLIRSVHFLLLWAPSAVLGGCNADNVLRALQANSAKASPFCSTYTLPPPNQPLPTYVSQYPASRVSSGCSCLVTTTSSSSSKTSSTTSTTTSSQTSSTISSSTSTSTSSKITTSTTLSSPTSTTSKTSSTVSSTSASTSTTLKIRPRPTASASASATFDPDPDPTPPAYICQGEVLQNGQFHTTGTGNPQPWIFAPETHSANGASTSSSGGNGYASIDINNNNTGAFGGSNFQQNTPGLCPGTSYTLTYTSAYSANGPPHSSCMAQISLADDQLVTIGGYNGDQPPWSTQTRNLQFWYSGNGEPNVLTVSLTCSANFGSYTVYNISLVGAG